MLYVWHLNEIEKLYNNRFYRIQYTYRERGSENLVCDFTLSIYLSKHSQTVENCLKHSMALHTIEFYVIQKEVWKWNICAM